MSSRAPVQGPSVGRTAFFGGIFLGAAIAIFGFYLIPKLGLSGILALPLEIGVVVVALQVTTRIWRRSAETPAQGAPGELDSGSGDRDRKEQ